MTRRSNTGRARVTRWRLQLRQPLVTAVVTITERRGLHLEVGNVHGEWAVGDVAPLPGFSPETLDEAEAALTRLLASTDVVRALPAAPAARRAWLADHELPSSVAHGIEQAVLTLRARPLNGSLACLLAAEQGRTPRPTVPTHRLWTPTAPPVACGDIPPWSGGSWMDLCANPTLPPFRGRCRAKRGGGGGCADIPPLLGGSAGTHLARSAATGAAAGRPTRPPQGVVPGRRPGRSTRRERPQAATPVGLSKLSAVKIKVGADLDAAEALVATVRAAVGDTMELRVDANGAWSPELAPEALRRMARHGVAWVEQPIAADAPDVLAHMAALRARKLGPGLAADESVRSAADARAVLAAGAADALVIKPMWCGGLSAALEIGRLAADAHVAVSVTTALESPIGAEAARAVAAAMPARLISCAIETRSFFVDPRHDDDHSGAPR